MERAGLMLPQLFTTIDPTAWTIAWLEVLDQADPFRGGETGGADMITSLVSGLIAQEILVEPEAA
ncbi:MAG: hypothetical protein M3O70_01145 [Actinomycetota bacterium]|nr:hypothetical protein [Actinomycetota bacterium]